MSVHAMPGASRASQFQVIDHADAALYEAQSGGEECVQGKHTDRDTCHGKEPDQARCVQLFVAP